MVGKLEAFLTRNAKILALTFFTYAAMC